MKTIKDIFHDNRWLQRRWVDGKYTWTTSGVLWNNIKERTNPQSETQRREPSYIGAINDFNSFNEFVLWNRLQVGYDCGYDLDSDILMKGIKRYSPETCLLIPPALNRFLQSRKRNRSQDLPMGLLKIGKKSFLVRNTIKDDISGKDINLIYTSVTDVETGMKLYAESVEKSKNIWIDRLENSGRYHVDNRVIHFLKNWNFVDDWKPNVEG